MISKKNISIKFFIFLVLFCISNLIAHAANSNNLHQNTPQTIYQDSIKKLQELKIQSWENQLKSARKRGDLQTEMGVLVELIWSKITNFGDNTSAYELAIELENLIHENPNNSAVKVIEADYNMLFGMLLRDQFRYRESLDYFEKAMEISKSDSLFSFYRDCSNHVGELYSLLNENEIALDHFNKLEKDGLPFEGDNMEFLTRIYQFKAEHFLRNNNLDSTLYYAKKSLYENAVTNMLSDRYHLIAFCYLETNKDIDSVIYNANKSLELAKSIGADREEIDSHDLLRQAYYKKGDFEKAFYHFQKFYEFEQNQKSFENAIKIGNVNIELEKRAAQLQQSLTSQKLSNQRAVIWMVSIGLIILVMGVFYIFNRLRVIQRQSIIIIQEKDKSENLLLNILPAEVAVELKEKGETEAQDFEMVSILFSDFKDFTRISENLSAKELVANINECFKSFDNIMQKYNIEKIKTIGDAYMAAGGLPIKTNNSVKYTVLAALEMQEFILKLQKEKEAKEQHAFEMRVGIHTGPVVAGIVGVKKFQYDIWGDTVNTASRMESSGEVGMVNVSEDTYNYIKDEPEFIFESRGKIEVKGKGKLKMYFVALT